MKIKVLTAALAAMMIFTACGETSAGSDDSDPLYKSTVTGQAPERLEESSSDSKSDSSTAKSDKDGDEDPTYTPVKVEAPKASDKVSKMLSDMTVEEKVAQLFIIRADTLEADTNTDIGVTWCDEDMIATLEKYPVGGVIYFAKNVVDPDQLKKLSADLQASSKYPLFISTDEEGGSVARIANDPDFGIEGYESMLDIGSSGDTKKAEEVGETIGKYLSDYGLNLDFAPVADIYSNPDNTVIGNRAFGKDAETVSKMVDACIDGFHSQNIMTCIKHYPGHGDTAADSHEGYVQVDKTWDELLEQELIPFIDNLDETDMVMAAHITLPNVTKDNLPASLSKTLLTDKLRGELGYNGVIITDALGMGAIADNYSAAESAVKVINAGADILLMPTSLESAYNAVLKAVKSGDITIERIDESVTRILNLKEKYGLLG